MARRFGKTKQIRTIKGIRGDDLVIDLGKSFTGNMKAWMKKDPDSLYYRTFEITDNRYLKMPKEKTIDYKNEDCSIVENIEGKWYFDVELENNGIVKTVYVGTIFFKNDITCSNGTELFADVEIQSIFNNQFNNIFS